MGGSVRHGGELLGATRRALAEVFVGHPTIEAMMRKWDPQTELEHAECLTRIEFMLGARVRNVVRKLEPGRWSDKDLDERWREWFGEARKGKR